MHYNMGESFRWYLPPQVDISRDNLKIAPPLLNAENHIQKASLLLRLLEYYFWEK